MADNCLNELFVVNSLTIDGNPFAVEQGSVTIDNLLGFELESVPSASGPHKVKRKAVVPMVKAKLQVDGNFDLEALKGVCCANMTLTQTTTNRRLRILEASISKLGGVGNGTADVEFICTTAPQWIG